MLVIVICNLHVMKMLNGFGIKIPSQAIWLYCPVRELYGAFELVAPGSVAVALGDFVLGDG